MRVVNQGVAGNSGSGLIGFAEATVDNDQFSSAFDWAFSLFCLYRHMPVDDMAMWAFQAEFFQNHVTDCGILIKRIIGIFGFCPCALIFDQSPLKGCHPVSAENRAVAPCPQEPQQIHSQLPFLGISFMIKGLPRGGIHKVKEFFSFPFLVIQAERH